MILNRKLETTMADILDAAAPVFTPEQADVLRQFADELLAKLEAQRVREERNAAIVASRTVVPRYVQNSEPMPADLPPRRRVTSYRTNPDGGALVPVYADE